MRIGGVGTQDNTSDILTKYLQPPLHVKYTRELNITQETHDQRQTLSNNVVRCLETTYQQKLTRSRPDPLRTINPRPPQTQIPTLHTPHQNCKFDPKTHRKPPEPSKFQDQTHRGLTHTSRQQDRDRQYPSRNLLRRRRQTQQHNLPPYKTPATMTNKPPKTSENHPKTRHDRRGDKRTHIQYTTLCVQHTHLSFQRITTRHHHT